ncbi:Ig-like domain repeat protein [Aeromicrobium sp. UC242_57]|uniref:Ig-like domain repeat protein n=1 Tax=Aeromicrobium sp. UC242_57 TaxID=3374624 RepID=UPI003788D5FF
MSDPKATGTIKVKVDGKSVTGTLSDGSATVTLPANVSVGTHVVTASYAGKLEGLAE